MGIKEEEFSEYCFFNVSFPLSKTACVRYSVLYNLEELPSTSETSKDLIWSPDWSVVPLQWLLLDLDFQQMDKLRAGVGEAPGIAAKNDSL